MGVDLLARLNEKLGQGEWILQSLQGFSSVEGCAKFARKVRAEMRFLQRLQKKPQSLKEDHLRSSNMENLQAIGQALQAAERVVAILATFTCADTGERLVVDIVAEDGALWMKVISRNPKALQRVSVGQGEFGQKSVVDQAERYITCAAGNPHFFRAPRVCFAFSAGVGQLVADQLEARGVEVTGERINDQQLGIPLTDDDLADSSESESESDQPASPCSPPPADPDSPDSGAAPRHPEVSAETTLNLDVTAMLAYVSNLTNGRCDVQFSEPVLAQQAGWERQDPVKPHLDRLFTGRRLVCCRSAREAFDTIVATVGGPNEKARAREFLQRVSVVEDAVADACAVLQARGKVKDRSAAVFGTGEALQIPTVTANVGFVRAAAGQGVRLTAFTHGSRALTEAKEPGNRKLRKPDSDRSNHNNQSNSNGDGDISADAMNCAESHNMESDGTAVNNQST